MPTRKIGEPPELCHNSEHDPPSHQYFEPGTYEHECPGCQRKLIFTVARHYL